VGRNSAFSYSASRYSYSYSKTPESIQVDHLFREAATPLFGPFVNEIPILLFEYEYRFTQYEYEKNHWYELLATIMPDGPKISSSRAFNLPPRPLGSMILPLGFTSKTLENRSFEFSHDRATNVDIVELPNTSRPHLHFSLVISSRSAETCLFFA